MIKFFVELICTLVFLNTVNGQHTISITISDAISKDKLAFANVYLKNNQLGASTDLSGKATIALSKPFVVIDTLVCSYVGYRDTMMVVDLSKVTSYLSLQ